jgi:calcium-dependent protein kinase
MKVLKKSPDFKDKPWPTISNSAVDFVKKLLQKDPHLRLSAAQALCMSSSYVIQLLHINWSLLVKCMPQKSIAKQSVIQFLLDVAAHEWVREEGVASDMPLDISVLSNMREFVKYSRLKQIALRVIYSSPLCFMMTHFETDFHLFIPF